MSTNCLPYIVVGEYYFTLYLITPKNLFITWLLFCFFSQKFAGLYLGDGARNKTTKPDLDLNQKGWLQSLLNVISDLGILRHFGDLGNSHIVKVVLSVAVENVTLVKAKPTDFDYTPDGTDKSALACSDAEAFETVDGVKKQKEEKSPVLAVFKKVH